MILSHEHMYIGIAGACINFVVEYYTARYINVDSEYLNKGYLFVPRVHNMEGADDTHCHQ
jgi:hypothetical protein